MKRLKIAYNDIFGKNIEEYWRNEGNNKRMQNYYKFAKLLLNFRYLLSVVICVYIIWLSLNTLTRLILGFNICTITNCYALSPIEVVREIYPTCSLILIGFTFAFVVLIYKQKIKCNRPLEVFMVVIALLPTLYLILFGFKYRINNITSCSTIVLIYLFIETLITYISNRIINLKKIAVGEERVVNLENGKGEE